MHARAQGNLFSLGLLVAVQYALLIALILVCHRMIRLSGGDVDLERLSFKEQSRLARAVVWRLLAVFFVCVIGSILLGLDRYYAATLWFGLDNIVYPWPGRYLPFWSAFIAILVYLMLVEKGRGRPPTLRAAVRQMALRWQYLVIAGLMMSAALYGFNIVTIVVDVPFKAFYQSLPSPLLKTGLYVLVTFLFSYARLWVTVAIVTYALRASYRKAADRGTV